MQTLSILLVHKVLNMTIKSLVKLYTKYIRINNLEVCFVFCFL